MFQLICCIFLLTINAFLVPYLHKLFCIYGFFVFFKIYFIFFFFFCFFFFVFLLEENVAFLQEPPARMGGIGSSYDTSIIGDVYVQRLAAYIRKNEEALANGLLLFSKSTSDIKVKPLKLTFTTHHLYYITERIDSSPLGVDTGPLNVKVDIPSHEPTFVSFLANNARSKNFDSDTRSISSISSVRSIMSTASVFRRSLAYSKDPRVLERDIRYLYSSFTKIPCLVLSPKTRTNNIACYEEYPCDTSVPLKMFKNLQVLELIDYEPNEIYGWHILSEQLRVLVIRNIKVSNLSEIFFNLVIEDEFGRHSFNSSKASRKHSYEDNLNYINHPFVSWRRRATAAAVSAKLPDFLAHEGKWLKLPTSYNDAHSRKDYSNLPEPKWSFLKQLAVSDTSITTIDKHVFKPFSNLVKLNLSNNLLESIPEGLDQLHSIKFLSFADNYIKDLSNFPANLRHLATLNLNNNQINSIGGLERLTTLERIDLRNNNINDILSLKPLVELFKNGNGKLSMVYLEGNGLPKTYRIELFNLFNGVKYKSGIKIDNSRPGYFESALLYDSETAAKMLEKYLSKSRNKKCNRDQRYFSAELQNGKHSSNNFIKSQFAGAVDFNSDNDSTTSIPRLEYVHPITANHSSPLVTSDTTSVISASSKNGVLPSPLGSNQNLTNTSLSELSNHKTKLVQKNTCPSTVSSIKRSSISQRGSLNSAAPGVITHVLVTAKMSN